MIWGAAIKPMARVLGIDYGGKRTGVALGETQSRLATPLKLLENFSDDALVVEIGRLAKMEGVDLIVCGIPLNMDGSAGPQAQKVEKIILQVEQATGIAVARVDERLTSHEAESRLAGHFTRRQKRQRIDAVAAAGILQEYLNHVSQ